MRRQCLMVLGIVMVTVTRGTAEEAKKLEPVVVTATKVETPADRLGASVTVITEDEIRTYNYTEIEDALRAVPGVEVQRSGSAGKATSIRIRGANPNQVQVLVDGMRVKSTTLGQFDFSDLSLDAIDRIEIVRGPQSTLHGADAIGGIVNIITKKGSGPPHGGLSFEGGSFETFREQGSVSGSVGRLNFSASASRTDSRGQERRFDNDDSDQTAFAGRLGFDFPWEGSLTGTARYAKSNTDAPGPFGADPDDQQETEFYLYTLRYDQKVLPWWSVAARLGQMWNDQRFESPPFAPSQINTRRLEVEVLSTWDIGQIDTLTLGFEHQRERGEIPGAFREEVNTRSFFAQNELRLFRRFILGGGLRYDDNDTFGDQLTPRASLVVLLDETNTRLRAAYGEGFRAPTFNDRFFPAAFGCPPFGNPDVRPETSRSWEGGVDQKLAANRVRFGFTYFRNLFENLITIVPTSGFCSKADNVGRARSEGVEFYSELEPFHWLVLNANYTFTDTEDQETGGELPRFARHRFNAGVTLTPIPRLSLFAQSYVVSRQLDSIGGPHNPGFHRIDVGGTLTLLQRTSRLDKLDLTVRIQNLTDESYSEILGFRALGFSALAGLTAYFR